MIISDFMMLATACAPAIHPITLSAVVMKESRGDVYAVSINNHQKISPQPSSFEEAITTAEQLRHDGHNLNIGLGQISVKNLEWLGMSLSDLFNPCKNLEAIQIILTHCYERAKLEYDSEQSALKDALNCYSVGNGERGFAMQKIASYVGVEVPALASIGDEEQEFVKLNTGEPKKLVKMKSGSVTSREELEDAFTNEASGVHDAFTAKYRSSSEKSQE
ncbi:lytic transglycosylase domain-containing protein [Bartonella sp. B10]